VRRSWSLAETIIGLFKTEVIRQRGLWRNIEAVESSGSTGDAREALRHVLVHVGAARQITDRAEVVSGSALLAQATS
jgi:hypothetical protein